MKEARLNPVAIANAVPKREVNYVPLGDRHGLLGVGLESQVGGDGVLRIFLVATCARISELVPISEKAMVKVVLGQAATIKTDDLVARISEAIDGPAELPPLEA